MRPLYTDAHANPAPFIKSSCTAGRKQKRDREGSTPGNSSPHVHVYVCKATAEHRVGTRAFHFYRKVNLTNQNVNRLQVDVREASSVNVFKRKLKTFLFTSSSSSSSSSSLPAIPLCCSSVCDRLDEDAELLQAHVGSCPHPDDADAEAIAV